MSDNLPAIHADNSGLIKARTLDEAWRMAQYFASSGLLPERYKSPAMVLTASQFALELGLLPITAMRQIAVVKGTPTVFGDLPLSIVYASKKLDFIEESYLDKNGKEISLANRNLTEPVYAALCIVKRKGETKALESFFSMDDAIAAGLTNSPTWKAYPKRMLRYRARSQALKDKFPDALNGISIAEYDHNTTSEQEMLNVTPAASVFEEVIRSESITGVEVPNTAKAQSLKEKLKAKLDPIDVIDAEIQ